MTWLIITTDKQRCQTPCLRHLSHFMTKPNKWYVRPMKTRINQPGHPPSLIRVFANRMKKAWSAQQRLIRLGGCPGWSESLLGAQSFCWFCHEAAHLLSAILYVMLLCLCTYMMIFMNEKHKMWVSLTYGLYLNLLIWIWARPWGNVSYVICEQQRRRSACASALSDQRLCCLLLR